MASYPALPIMVGSEEEWEDDLEMDIAVNGAPKVRAFYSTKKKLFKVVHKYLTATQKNTLQTFYDSNRLLVVQLVWTDGVTYNCFFKSVRVSPIEVTYWNAESILRQQ